MAFLTDECVRVPLTERVIAVCSPFSCGNKDLDEFFSVDFLDYRKQLMGKTYAFVEVANPTEIVCAFTVSNASIFTNCMSDEYLVDELVDEFGQGLTAT